MEPLESTSPVPIVLTADEITAIPSEPLGSIEGVAHRVLWRNDTSMAGVLTVDGGHRLGTHAHRVNHHHMWVLDGQALILGTEVGPGSYLQSLAGWTTTSMHRDRTAARSSTSTCDRPTEAGMHHCSRPLDACCEPLW